MGQSPLRLSMVAALVSLGLAGVFGLIGVIDADSASEAIGRGVGTALAIFAVGPTLAVAFACARRGQLAWWAFGSVVAAGATSALFALALWLTIESEWYGKVTGVAVVWTFFALIGLGLVLAVGPPGLNPTSSALCLGTLVAACAAGLVSTYLVLTAGNVLGDTSSLIGNSTLLRVLGAAFVVISVLWFSALAASRLERA